MIFLVVFLFQLVFFQNLVFSKFVIGADYYPDHIYGSSEYIRKTIQEDAIKMEKCGIEFVRVGEYMWSTYEPHESEYDFTLLDSTFEILDSHGVKIMLGTPSGSPPAWVLFFFIKNFKIIQKYGGLTDQNTVLPFSEDGRVLFPGCRSHYRFSSVDYRYEVKKIVEKISKRYGNRTSLFGWQVDNEYSGVHVRSSGPLDLKHFHEWLENKYQRIENLNEIQGNRFWSVDYESFSEIGLPSLTLNGIDGCQPAMQLDWNRFNSDNILSFNQMQVNEIKKYSTAPVTTNFGYSREFDLYGISQQIDFNSWDCYPVFGTSKT